MASEVDWKVFSNNGRNKTILNLTMTSMSCIKIWHLDQQPLHLDMQPGHLFSWCHSDCRLVLASNSSSGSAGSQVGTQRYHLTWTQRGQKQYPQSFQVCRQPGLTLLQQSPLHMVHRLLFAGGIIVLSKLLVRKKECKRKAPTPACAPLQLGKTIENQATITQNKKANVKWRARMRRTTKHRRQTHGL